jgi:hypothetical protein
MYTHVQGGRRVAFGGEADHADFEHVAGLGAIRLELGQGELRGRDGYGRGIGDAGFEAVQLVHRDAIAVVEAGRQQPEA